MSANKEQKYTNPDISSLIPVVSHYDSVTLMTRTGDLIKTISVSGFENNDELFGRNELSEVFRNSLKMHIKSAEYAVYIHIMNNTRNIILESSFKSESVSQIEQTWNKINKWSSQDISMMYITIVSRGMHESAFNPKTAIRSLSFRSLKAAYYNNLARRNEELSGVVSGLIKDIGRFGAKLLNMRKTEKGYVSEPLSFINKLLHLKENDIFPSTYNLASQISDLNIDYFFSSLQFTDYDSKANEKSDIWAAVYTIKVPCKLDHEECIKLLDFEGKYIISEVAVFAPAHIALKNAKYQKKVTDISKDEDIATLTGVAELMNNNTLAPTDFCERQITITIYEYEQELFFTRTKEITRLAQEIGLIMVREDFNCPKCFFSQIPGNFRYITRKQYTSGKNIGFFSSIAEKKNGSYHGSKWGDPISIFKTVYNTAYYFNFHDVLNDPNNGNTIVFGEKDSIKNKLIRFLIAQAMRINPKIINISINSDDKKFLESIGAKTFNIGSLDSDNKQLIFDLLDLQNFENDIELFSKVLANMILGHNEKLHNKYDNKIIEVAEKMQQLQTTQDKINLLLELAVGDHENDLLEAVKAFLEKFNKLCTAQCDISTIISNQICNIDFGEHTESSDSLHIISNAIAILLMRIIKLLDGNPTIIVFNEFDMLYNNKIMEKYLKPLLKFIAEKNAIVLLGSKYNEKLYAAPFFKSSLDCFASLLFTGHRVADNLARKSFKLTHDELYSIKSSGNKKNLVLLKQQTDTLSVRFEFNNIASLLESGNSL